jgi:ribonuclease P protein component
MGISESPNSGIFKVTSWINYETHLPTLQSQTRPHTRLFDAHENPRRPRRDRRAQSQRPQAARCLGRHLGKPENSFVLSFLQGTLEDVDQSHALMHRLKSRPQFQAVLAGSIVAKTSHFAMHCTPTKTAVLEPLPQLFTAGVWLGAMVPKRWAKRAVTRNAIKRQIYAVGASLNPQFPQAAFLVRLRQEFSRQAFSSACSPALQYAIRAELMDLFERGLKAK